MSAPTLRSGSVHESKKVSQDPEALSFFHRTDEDIMPQFRPIQAPFTPSQVIQRPEKCARTDRFFLRHVIDAMTFFPCKS